MADGFYPMADGFQAMADGFFLTSHGFFPMTHGFQAMARGFQAIPDGFFPMAHGFKAMADGFRALREPEVVKSGAVHPTRIYLVRHGATQLTAENRFSGATGVDLSEEGRMQAALLGERLRRDRIDAIYASTLSRAVETAEIIGTRCGLTATTIDALREISHGHWEGLTRAEVEERFPGEYQAWEEDPFTYAPEGGESGVAVLARALPALRTIVTSHPGQNVVIVSHKATIRLLLSSFLGFDERGYRDRLDQAPACLNVLDFRDAVHVRLMLFNDTSHYSERPRQVTQNLSKWWDEQAR